MTGPFCGVFFRPAPIFPFYYPFNGEVTCFLEENIGRGCWGTISRVFGHFSLWFVVFGLFVGSYPSVPYVSMVMTTESTSCHTASNFIPSNYFFPVSVIMFCVAVWIFLSNSFICADMFPLLFIISPSYLYASTSCSCLSVQDAFAAWSFSNFDYFAFSCSIFYVVFLSLWRWSFHLGLLLILLSLLSIWSILSSLTLYLTSMPPQMKLVSERISQIVIIMLFFKFLGIFNFCVWTLYAIGKISSIGHPIRCLNLRVSLSLHI